MQPDHDAPRLADDSVSPAAWRALALLMTVYVLNFIDRQLLTILAPDVKRDLGIGDSQFGFLYGTVFGVFYAIFGIPLGKLADRWSRVKLLSIGLTVWSLMTAASGLARNFTQIAGARMLVGVGEATAGPCAYSLISDHFPPRRRATALGVYSAGLYIGGGISLFLGSAISSEWNARFGANPPFGLAGWQAAFLAVGLPGLLIALAVFAMAEPRRGRFDDHPHAPDMATAPAWAAFLKDASTILPPLTLISAARRGSRALMQNLAALAVVSALMFALWQWLGDPVQWVAFGIGLYATASWLLAIRDREPDAYAGLVGSTAFTGVTLGYGLIALLGYAATAFMPLYAIEVLGAEPRKAGLVLGALGAVGGGLGVVFGGWLADRASVRHGVAGRVAVILVSCAMTVVFHIAYFSSSTIGMAYTFTPLVWIGNAAALGGAAGVVVGIVSPSLRGTATAAFLLGTNLIGLAMGPYTAGKIAEATGDLGKALILLALVAPVALTLLFLAWNSLRKANDVTA